MKHHKYNSLKRFRCGRIAITTCRGFNAGNIPYIEKPSGSFSASGMGLGGIWHLYLEAGPINAQSSSLPTDRTPG